MAFLVRPWTYRYIKDGKRVPKGTPGAKRVKERARKWYGVGIAGLPPRKRVPLASDKTVAQKMLADRVRKGERAVAGLSTPLDEHEQRPLLEHLEDFGRDLAAKGDTAEYVQKTTNRCRAILNGIEAVTLGELQPSAVQEWVWWRLRDRDPKRVEIEKGKEEFTRKELAAILGINIASVARLLKRYGLHGYGNGKARRYSRAVVEALQERFCLGTSTTTRNHYLTAIKNFTHWLVKDRRASFDVLACLSRLDAKTDIRVVRRALTPKEFQDLLNAARNGRQLRSLSGEDRAILYMLAARTGLRASELASLTPASFFFHIPSVIIEAAYSKRRRRDEQPLPPDLAAKLKTYLQGLPRNSRIWPGSWRDCAALLLREDLAAAGIPYIDDRGRVYDFHSLRHQFITDMVDSGVHPKDAQALARHSTITLTLDRYAHVRPANLHAALGRLPSLTEAPAQEQKTG
jgi:integrase